MMGEPSVATTPTEDSIHGSTSYNHLSRRVVQTSQVGREEVRKHHDDGRTVGSYHPDRRLVTRGGNYELSVGRAWGESTKKSGEPSVATTRPKPRYEKARGST
jgi:hypothetical protein